MSSDPHHLPHLCAEVCACIPPQEWEGPVLNLLDEAFSSSIRAAIMEIVSQSEGDPLAE